MSEELGYAVTTAHLNIENGAGGPQQDIHTKKRRGNKTKYSGEKSSSSGDTYVKCPDCLYDQRLTGCKLPDQGIYH